MGLEIKDEAENEVIIECTLQDTVEDEREVLYRTKMQDLIEGSVRGPSSTSMSDWYYMQEHVTEGGCEHCALRYESLVEKAIEENQWSGGPTTLRKSE